MIHKFETRHQDNQEFALSDRLPHAEVLAQRDMLCTPAFLATVKAVPSPLLFFNPTRQLVHANPAALRIVDDATLESVIGLRMGEFLGCDHLMQDTQCTDFEDCQNCNSMAAIMAALAGQATRQELRLVIHPRSRRSRQAYEVSSIPVPQGDVVFAMLVLEKAD